MKRKIMFMCIAGMLFGIAGCSKNESAIHTPSKSVEDGKIVLEKQEQGEDVSTEEAKEEESVEEPVEEPEEVIVRTAVKVSYEHGYSDENEEYAVIKGLDDNDQVVWELETERNPGAQVDAVYEIGEQNGKYYYEDSTGIYAVNIADGSLLWHNSECSGSSFQWGQNGELYLCSFLGSYFMAIDDQGNTLCKIDQTDPDFSGAFIEKCEDNMLTISFEYVPDEYIGKDVKFVVDLNDYSYSFTGMEPEADVEDENLQSANDPEVLYAPVLELYRDAITNKHSDRITSAIPEIRLSVGNEFELGVDFKYTFVDLNGDSVMELMIADMATSRDMGYDLRGIYGYDNGQIVSIEHGWCRYLLWLCEDNMILAESNAGMATATSFYRLEPGSLQLSDVIVYEGDGIEQVFTKKEGETVIQMDLEQWSADMEASMAQHPIKTDIEWRDF